MVLVAVSYSLEFWNQYILYGILTADDNLRLDLLSDKETKFIGGSNHTS